MLSCEIGKEREKEKKWKNKSNELKSQSHNTITHSPYLKTVACTIPEKNKGKNKSNESISQSQNTITHVYLPSFKILASIVPEKNVTQIQC